MDANKDHGVLIEFPLYVLEKVMNITNEGDIFVMRHIICHILFLFGCVYFFKLINLLYYNKMLSLIGFFLILLHPTIYTHSFFNSKDVPFLALTIFFFYQFAIAFRDKKAYRFILLGLSLALLISLRIMGIMYAVFTLMFILNDIVLNIKDKSATKRNALYAGIVMLSTCFFTIALWPALWENPVGNFIEIFGSFSKFRWDSTVLFLGENINGQNLPWYYSVIWFIINNPILYLLLGFAGIAFFVWKFKISKLNQHLTKNNLLYLFSFIAPVLSVIALKSVIFDGWRHLFFIYPAFILLGIYGLNELLQYKIKPYVFGVLIITFLYIVSFSIYNFPHQHVYFNRLVPRTNEYIRHHFDMDYWGLAFKQSLEHILETDSSSKIKVAGSDFTYVYNTFSLKPEQAERIEIMKDSLEKADYFIANYRWHHQDYTEINAKEVFSIEVSGSKINTVYKINH